jgi:hypothetical protein
VVPLAFGVVQVTEPYGAGQPFAAGELPRKVSHLRVAAWVTGYTALFFFMLWLCSGVFHLKPFLVTCFMLAYILGIQATSKWLGKRGWFNK